MPNCGAMQDDMPTTETGHTAETEDTARDTWHNTQHQQSDVDEETSTVAVDESAVPRQQKALSHQQVKRLKRQKAKGGAVQPAKLQPNTAPPSTLCATCGMDCYSRNKLFAHLKTTGHAAYK